VLRRLVCIVEGHGEVESVPLLVRRVCKATNLVEPEIRKNDVIRRPRSQLIREGEIERAIDLAGRRVGSGGAILVLLDADDDLPCELAPKLLTRAQNVRPDCRVAVVLAMREYEGWFLAAARSLAGKAGIPTSASPPPNPQNIRDAKGLIGAWMGQYRPILQQPRLTALMDLDEARSAPSFDKLWREVNRILANE